MTLDETERQNLLLHILSKVDFIDGYSKLYNLMYLLKGEIDEELADYKFDNQFLTIKDNALDNDLKSLILQNFVNNDSIERELAHQHRIEIKKIGLSYLKIQQIEKKLKEKLGKETLRNIDIKIKEYNDMSINNVILLVNNRTQNVS